MHRYREFGLLSGEDETLRRAFRDGFRRAGLSFAQHVDALAWYRDHARTGLNEGKLVEAFSAFAADRGWSAEHRDGALDLYRVIRDKGAAAVIAPAPHADADRAKIAECEHLLRSDPARYWGDAELQDAVFEARERLAAASADRGDAGLLPSTPDQQRIAEVETLLRDPSGEGRRRYWNDEKLRADYAQALARFHGDAAASGRNEGAPGLPPSADIASAEAASLPTAAGALAPGP
jgi:hypothetical protein